jgi:hypothetical protein
MHIDASETGSDCPFTALRLVRVLSEGTSDVVLGVDAGEILTQSNLRLSGTRLFAADLRPWVYLRPGPDTWRLLIGLAEENSSIT